jgi:hypothetical protein
MSPRLCLKSCLTSFVAFLLLSPASFLLAQEQPTPDEIAEMMGRATKYTQPGDKHAVLQRLIGTWDTEFRITMAGAQTPPEKGQSVFSWLMPGRWLKQESKGSVMGMPHQTFSIMGYDNFKQSYVVTTVNTMDTAMLRSEGDLDQTGKVLITYGTLDEYLTGEHDKMVKYVWRFVSDDEIVFEVHDLPIGEKNTQVIEIKYKRKQSAG